ncbi:MAG: hypothetical protein KUG73_11490, partial [Pseudomonadales bacterium]|nr:hypothetical protein [Pseudomonadales bacterium]
RMLDYFTYRLGQMTFSLLCKDHLNTGRTHECFLFVINFPLTENFIVTKSLGFSIAKWIHEFCHFVFQQANGFG